MTVAGLHGLPVTAAGVARAPAAAFTAAADFLRFGRKYVALDQV
jgi:hypothetical protein